MVDKLTVRDIDEDDLDVLKKAAEERGTSLSRYVVGVLHQQARLEHRRQLFAAVAAQEPDMPRVDSVAEVRALREEQDTRADDVAGPGGQS